MIIIIISFILICMNIHSFLCCLIPRYLSHYIHILQSFIRSFIRSFVHSFIHSFVHSFIRSFIHSFLFYSIPLIHSFVVSFLFYSIPSIQSFVHSIIYLFILLRYSLFIQIINKPKKKEELSEEDKHKQMMSFIDRYEKEIKHFGMLQNNDARWERIYKAITFCC